MAVDICIKIDTIKGESKIDGHTDEIDVESYSFGMTQTGIGHVGGGSGAGKVNMQDLHLVKRVDAASHALMLACAAGTHIKEATLSLRRAGDKPLDYLKIKLEDVLVSSVQDGASNGTEIPTEQVSLNFSKVYFGYTKQKSDGSADGAPLEFKWDVKVNKKL